MRQDEDKNRNSGGISLTLTYHSLAIPVKKTIYKNRTLVSYLLTTKQNAFSHHHQGGFQERLNLRDILVRFKLEDVSQRPGATTGGRFNCRNCKHSIQDTEVSITTVTFSGRQSLAASSSCFIYCEFTAYAAESMRCLT